uniref:Mitochondrial carrier 1 n=1 Tax=Vombatus ursinus TaxID=29139 RepID=A0A4X2L9R5_VOMUR
MWDAALFLVLGASIEELNHLLFYMELLIQVGHEPLPPTAWINVLGSKSFYLPNFFTSARHIVQVAGKKELFRGLNTRLMSSALSKYISNEDGVKTSLRKVVKETSPYQMVWQCMSRVLFYPLHIILMHCMVQFEGQEVKYSGMLSFIGEIFKEELLGFFVDLIPHLLGDVILWGCNLLAHFISDYVEDDSFSQALAVMSYTKFVMGIAGSMLTYPFLLVGDLMAVNNYGLLVSFPPYSPVSKSWVHYWRYLSMQGQLFWASSLLFCQILATSNFSID